MNKTPIEWADLSLNIFAPDPDPDAEGKGKAGWACVKVSPGCKNCYAERLNYVRGNGRAFTLSNLPTMTLVRDRLKPLKKPARNHETVFLNSMTDTFLEAIPADLITEALDALLAAAGTNRTFIILTKRADRMRQIVMDWLDYRGLSKVPDHMILGVSTESQQYAEARLPALLAIPARRMVSAEPLLGPLDLTAYLWGLHWVIAGGESGPYNAHPPIRASHPAWLESLQRQTAAAPVPVPYFFKQWGEWVPEDELSLNGLKPRLDYQVKARGLLSHTGEWLTTDEEDGSRPDYAPPAYMVRVALQPRNRKPPATLNGILYTATYRPAEYNPPGNSPATLPIPF